MFAGRFCEAPRIGVWHRRPSICLLNDLERRTLPVTRRRAGEKRTDRLNGLSVAADNSTHVRLTQLNFEDRRLPRRNLGEHHLIRKFDELTNDKLEKLFHDFETIRPCAQAASPRDKSGSEA